MRESGGDRSRHATTATEAISNERRRLTQNTGRDPNAEDLSLSEGDDEVFYDLDCTGDLQSLYAHGRKVKDVKNLDIPSSEGNNGMHGIRDQEGQVVQLQSSEKHIAYNSSSESISDEENIVPSKLSSIHRVQGGAHHLKLDRKQQDKGTALSAGLEEARKLVRHHTKNHSTDHLCEEKRHCDTSSVKTNCSDHSHLNSGVVWSHMSDRNQRCFAKSGGQSDSQHRISEDSIAMQLGYIEASEEMQVNSVSHVFKGVPSIAELLEDLKEKDGSTAGASNMLLQNVIKERKTHTFSKKNSLGTRILDDEDPLELMEDEMSNSEEENDKTKGHGTNKNKQQTMTDLFQEAFSACTPGALLLHKTKHKGTGYYARLQQVMQNDKDKHQEFLNKLQKVQSSLNGLRHMTVRILSRSLEGKLTVCHCLLCDNIKHDDEMSADEKKWNSWRTVIFSSKICEDVELEVGNLICIHPPWKEVMVNNDEKIILCTYFSSSTSHEQ